MQALQLTLGGVEERPITDRIFFAIFPDTETAERIAEQTISVRSAHQIRGKPIAPARLHITLHHLGDHAGVPAGIVESAVSAGNELEMPCFEVILDRVSSFNGRPRNHPLVLRGDDARLAQLYRVHQSLGRHLSEHGLARYAKKRFTPHLTLMYGDKRIDEHTVEPIVWTAREVVLVHSLLGRSVHRHIGRWTLDGD